ncbi:MAG: SPOR domain-containing protein [Paracoccaceae bacterium]
MADADYDDFDDYQDIAAVGDVPMGHRPRFQSWVNGAGAITSVALIAGLGLWAYKLAVRDVSGIPVIQALEGPARIAPDNPGGELAVHQGMAVNEIAAEGTAADPADRLTLAPRAVGLSDADQPMGAFAPQPDGVAPARGVVAPATGEEAAETTLASVRPDQPLPDGPAEPIGDDEAFVAPDVISTDIPGVAQSLRPQVRPAPRDTDGVDAMAEAAAAAVAEAMAPQETADVEANALPEGTRLVQIGAYPSQAEARLGWDQTAMRFGALMDGKRRVIEPAESGGQTFFRLRVEGFGDLDDARRFCAALKADNAECVPTTVR